MGNEKLIKKLKGKVNITYEDAKFVLEENNWNILDAMIYLESMGKVKAPDVGIFFTNNPMNNCNIPSKCSKGKYWEYYNNGYTSEASDKNNCHYHKGFFERICEFIERCNNVFIEIVKDGEILTRLPLTVVVLLLFFCFRVVMTITLIALFCDVQFALSGENFIGNNEVINNFFSAVSKKAKKTRENIRNNKEKKNL